MSRFLILAIVNQIARESCASAPGRVARPGPDLTGIFVFWLLGWPKRGLRNAKTVAGTGQGRLLMAGFGGASALNWLELA